MSHVRVTHDTAANPDACWTMIADFGNIHRFNPYLTHSSLLRNAEQPTVGTERQCDLKGGGYLRERVVDWQEGCQYTVQIHEGRLPMDEVKTTLGLVRRARGATLFMETRYVPRFGIVGTVLDALVLRRVIAARFGIILASLAEKAEGTREPLAAA